MLKTGEIHLLDVLAHRKGYMLSHCEVYHVLRRTPRLGKKGAKRVCINADVWPLDRICDLSKDEIRRITHVLPLRAKKRKGGD